MSKFVTEYFDSNTLTYYKQYTEDVGPLIDSLAEYRNHSDPNQYKKNDARWRKIGELPMIVLDQWFREGFNPFRNDDETRAELKRRISTDYKKFLAVDKL